MKQYFLRPTLKLLERKCSVTSNGLIQIINQHNYSNATIEENEAVKFKRFANYWWDPSGDLKPLHTMNRLRVPFIQNGLSPSTIEPITGSVFLPLKDKKILDVGCGGGILTEPLSMLGAQVLGIDQVEESINSAKEHVEATSYRWVTHSNLQKPVYRLASLQTIAQESPCHFDAVVASEVLEHVTDWEGMLKSITDCLKLGGMLFVTTINHTTTSLLLGIVAAEYIVGIVPRGTHEWNKFIEPSRLQFACIKHGLQPRQVIGMQYNPLTCRWSWRSNLSVNYALSAMKVDRYSIK
ncbi:unnamed protein product [Heterobilharzia americana]|nr:unnamed protein product [Heterobilharzia americana]